MIILAQWLLFGVGALGLLVRGRWRDPRVIFLAGSIAAGYWAMLTLSQPGSSQLWFSRSTAVFIAVLSTWGLSVLIPDPVPPRLAYRLLSLAIAAGAATWLVRQWTEQLHQELESGRGSAAPGLEINIVMLGLLTFFLLIARRLQGMRGNTGAVPMILMLSIFLGLGLSRPISLFQDVVTGYSQPEPYVSSISPGGIDAARWLMAHSDPDDVVATNGHCRLVVEPGCDNRKFWVAAFTERRVVIEGWGFTPQGNNNATVGSDGVQTETFDYHRLAVNDAAFSHPSDTSVAALADRYGATWLFVDLHYPADLAGLHEVDCLTLAHKSGEFAIFRVQS